MINSEQIEKERLLRVLRKQYPTIAAASEEIINLKAILSLPKGTEHFLSDIHGEYESFTHILKNASGVIKGKIDDIFSNTMTERERKTLATLIYYPEEKLELIKKTVDDLDEWYALTLYRLVEVCKVVTSKYTRSKVRKQLPQGFDYIIDELLHSNNTAVRDEDKRQYYKEIINTIIRIKRADEFIIAISMLIQSMAIDKLHILGDIYDRGSGSCEIMDVLMKYHAIDIQWGNHDILWMGAAAGSDACIANVIRLCAKHDNMAILENKYGINLTPLANFTHEIYNDDPCECFVPKEFMRMYSENNKMNLTKIHKAITVIQLKLEGLIIKSEPDYCMEDRLLLERIDYEKGTVIIDGTEYILKDTFFPTIDKEKPYELTREEQDLINALRASFRRSTKLKTHVEFLFQRGNLYKICNSILMFHGCIPIDEAGDFKKVKFYGREYSGKGYIDYASHLARTGFFTDDGSPEKKRGQNFLWYLWCGKDSPLFGKDKAAVFEQYFIADEEIGKEVKNPYYRYVETADTCIKILKEFGLDPAIGHIVNGHVPVLVKKGEKPVKAEGKLIVIDGGLSRTYRDKTGIAGYTLIYNSHGLVLASHEPFESRSKAITEEIDIHSEKIVLENIQRRKMIEDTDDGKEINEQISNLEMLLQSYRDGVLRLSADE